MNTDQECQFTSEKWLKYLQDAEMAISMDGKGRWIDNVVIDRFWRSIKYKDIYLKSYENPRELAKGIGAYVLQYNHDRPHHALSGETPEEVYSKQKAIAA